MKIKDYARNWPPSVTVGSGGDIAKANLDDVVLSAQQVRGTKDHITLRLRKENGAEYGVTLFIPENLPEKAIVMMVDKKDRTLREVGDLDLS